jgi:very-short-patch-repair endonuclease
MAAIPRRETLRARQLRRSMSLPEVLLWQQLRRRPAGLRFHRQHPLGDYVLDFWLASARLAVEVDGGQHAHPAVATHDAKRDAWLAAKGVKVLRVPATAVLADAGGVVAMIVGMVTG